MCSAFKTHPCRLLLSDNLTKDPILVARHGKHAGVNVSVDFPKTQFSFRAATVTGCKNGVKPVACIHAPGGIWYNFGDETEISLATSTNSD